MQEEEEEKEEAKLMVSQICKLMQKNIAPQATEKLVHSRKRNNRKTELERARFRLIGTENKSYQVLDKEKERRSRLCRKEETIVWC